jgi:hypothetical protein
MNEHTKLLAEQARSLGNDEASYLERVHNRTYTIDEVNEIHYQKFAQLIVAECMTMSDELTAEYLTRRKSTMDFAEKNICAEGETACDILKYKMKRHFGVEL